MNSRIGLAAAVLLLAVAPAGAQNATPMLAQQVSSIAASLAPGQAPVSQIFGSFGAHRAPVSFMVPLAAGTCYTFIGAGGMGVRDVDMFLFDPGNRRVGLDRRSDNYCQITFCTPFAGPYRVELKVKRGEGEVAVQAFAPGGQAPPPQYAPPPPPALPPPTVIVPPPAPRAVQPMAPPPIAAPMDMLGGQLAQMAAAVAPGQRQYGPVLAGFSSEGRGQDLFVTLEGGRCYTFVSVGSPMIRQLNSYLFMPGRGKRLASERSRSNMTKITHCAAFPGPYHLEIKAEEGGGEFRTGVYTP
ncbi:MAG: hypothetical protein EXR72_03055 [Myxococcales bacterium]|nr:hypothetical protein [Myxococcales bacterium]